MVNNKNFECTSLQGVAFFGGTPLRFVFYNRCGDPQKMKSRLEGQRIKRDSFKERE